MASILLVDRNDLVVAALRDVLESSGYAVVIGSFQSDVSHILLKQQYDLAIIGVPRAYQTGIQFIRKFRDANPHQRILVMLGDGSLEQLNLIEELSTLRSVATIEKPFRNADLLESVEALVNL